MTRVVSHRYKATTNREKTLGAVYTPPRVASALVRWAVRHRDDRVLDPSCGEGVFLAAARTHLADLGNTQPTCVGVDIDREAAAAAGAVCADFFEWASSSLPFDAVVGNPPFIRSHLFAEESRRTAFEQMAEMGLHPSRLMSTWAPFVALSCRILSPTGRLAFVVPEELLHVGYAAELRRFLLSRFRRVFVCMPNGDLFPSVQQAVVLLLCDNESSGSGGLLTMPFADLESGPPYRAKPAPSWEWCSKWTHLFLSEDDRKAVAEGFRLLDWRPMSHYGRAEVGVVTGDNSFFIVSENQAAALGHNGFLTPIVTSARDLAGIRLTAADFRQVASEGRPVFLIHIAYPLADLSRPLEEYFSRGKRLGVHLKYKCRIRNPWYAVPSVWPADALLLRQAGEVPKLVHLTKKCASTDTIHRVRWHQPSLGKRHVTGFLNTWSLIACEIMGRSYGGGVLELMPSEANSIPMPPPLQGLDKVFFAVDERVRQREFVAAIELVDALVTPPCVPAKDREQACEILAKLIARRKTRQNGNH